jgi:hypothetical protein
MQTQRNYTHMLISITELVKIWISRGDAACFTRFARLGYRLTSKYLGYLGVYDS